MFGSTLMCLLLILPFGDSCPNKCQCRDFRTLCSYSRIKSLPRGLPPSTEFLRMEGDILTELNSSIIKDSGLTELKRIILIKTHMQKLKRLTFSDMNKLESINFSENDITEIEIDTFSGLDKLYKLDLSYNNINNLTSGVFNGLNNLRHLNISFNLIKNLHFGFFDGLGQNSSYELQDMTMRIDLSRNPISQIAPNAFRHLGLISKLRIESSELGLKQNTFLGLSKLTTLIIEDQNIGRPLHKNALRGLNSLKYFHMTDFNLLKLPPRFLEDSKYLNILSLPHNGIKKLDTEEFSGLKYLTKLNLEKNHLSHLNNNVFQYLESLISLNLRKNWIAKIQPQAFKGLKNLKLLDFSNNGLRFLNSSVFNFPMLRKLNFEGNFVESVEAGFFTEVSSLKSFDLSGRYPMESTTKNLFALRRLDSLKYSGNISLEGIQVLKSLYVHIDASSFGFDDVSFLIWQMLRFPHYIQEPITLKISGMKTITPLGSLSKFNISTLDLSPGNIRFLKKNIFHMGPKFNRLILRRCRIKSIEQRAFHGMDTLLDLDLSHNPGISLQTGMFMGLNNLTKLNLRNNTLTLIRPGVFTGLTNLKELILEENDIIKIENGAFKGLNVLVSLLLSINKIESLLPSTFKEIGGVQKLDLSKNQISTIDTGVFGAICPTNFNATCKNLTKLDDYCNTSHALKKLRYLDLSFNKIEQIDTHAFLSCNKLRTLLIDGNGMLTLDAKFLLLPGLRKFSMQVSNLTKLPNSTFQCTSQLSEIYFFGNNITDFKVGVLQPITKLRKIEMPDVDCNCDLYEVWQWLRNRRSQTEIDNPNNVCGYRINLDTVYSALECNGSSYSSSAQSNNTSDYFRNFKLYIEPIILIIIFITGFSGNALLLYTILRHSEMRTIQNVCIVHLTIADITALALNLPLSYWDALHGTWELDLTTCRLFLMSKDFTVVLVVYSVVALCIERFMIVRTSYNLRNGCRIYQSQPTLFIFIIWIFATITTLPVYFTATVKDRCLFCSPDNTNYIQRIWTFQFIMYCFVPAVSITILNTMTTYTLRKSVREMPGVINNSTLAKNRISVANMVMILAAVFSVSYFPNFFLRMYVSYTVNDNDSIFIASFVTYCLFFSHTILNPIAIFVMGSKFKAYIFKYVRHITGRKENEHIPHGAVKSNHPQNSQRIDMGIRSRNHLTYRARGVNRAGRSRMSNHANDIDSQIRQARMERLAKLQRRFY